MIVQTLRRQIFASCLRGELVGVDASIDGHVPLRCRGVKAETGEPYEFRVLLTEAEFALLVRAGAGAGRKASRVQGGDSGGDSNPAPVRQA